MSSPRRSVRYRPVPAVKRAAAILRLLANTSDPLGVSAVSRQLGIIPSTALHVLRELAAQHLVKFDGATKRYQLDAGVLEIARGMLQSNNLIYNVQTELHQLSGKLGIALFAVRVNDLADSTVVAVAETDAPLRVAVRLGTTMPALAAATGRCVAAFGNHDKKMIELKFQKLKWDKTPSYSDWLAEVDAVKRRGYAVDRGQSNSGLTVISVPVLDGARFVSHAVVAIGVNEKVASLKVDRIARELKEVAKRVFGEPNVP